jgi:hypothetical protein
MVMKRKAQGALEFLMTYGWAFLVILIMIGALAYFGVLNPSKLLPDKCMFGSPFMCKNGALLIKNDAALSGNIIVDVVNNFGGGVYVYNATIVPEVATWCTAPRICFDEVTVDGTCAGGNEVAGDAAGTLDFDAAYNNRIAWNEGVMRRIVVDCTGGNTMPQGDKVKLTLKFKWYPANSDITYKKEATGDLYAAVQ